MTRVSARAMRTFRLRFDGLAAYSQDCFQGSVLELSHTSDGAPGAPRFWGGLVGACLT